jgi:hypothetical protein
MSVKDRIARIIIFIEARSINEGLFEPKKIPLLERDLRNSMPWICLCLLNQVNVKIEYYI